MMRIITSTLAAIALVLGVATAAAPPAPAGESTPITPIMEPTGRAQLDGAQQDSTPPAGPGGYDTHESTPDDTGSAQQDTGGTTGVPVEAPAVESSAEDTGSTGDISCLHPLTGERIECSEDTPDGVLVIAVPCETDDGTIPAGAAACWWDSTLQGNGRGVSYIVYRTA